MTIHRRRWLELAAAAMAGAASARIAGAQTWPARPIRLVVPLPAGGAADIIARLFAARLERLGQPVIVDNKPGAGTTVGVQSVVTAAPDGHTLLVTTTASAIGATLYEKLPYNFLQDIVPVAGLVRFPLVMTVNRSVPASTVAEFIAYAKANPGKINMGSGRHGHSPAPGGRDVQGDDRDRHDPRPLPRRAARVGRHDCRTGPGHVQRCHRLDRASAQRRVAGARGDDRRAHRRPARRAARRRHVPGYEASGWFGVGAPKGVPADIVDRLAREINRGLADPEVGARIADLGSTPLSMSSAEFGAFMAAESEKWAKVVKLSGAKPD